MLDSCSPTLSEARKKSKMEGRKAPRRNETEWLTLPPSCRLPMSISTTLVDDKGIMLYQLAKQPATS
jgi:hypothetical protein